MEHIASISYGKDSLAMLEVIHRYQMPLDRIVTVEVMATKTIPADLPPMQEFKAKADKIIRDRYGISVEHLTSGKTYEDYFYSVCMGEKSINRGKIYGFPVLKGNWCNSRLKVRILEKIEKNAVSYIGIAADEPERFHTLNDRKRSPLVEHGWTEAMCREWCAENGLLSPIYEKAARGGCWFCHNQGVESLRNLRHDYPDLWALLLKWDADSYVHFKPTGRTVHDFDRRFQMEDEGRLPTDKTFKWEMVFGQKEER